MGNSVTGQEGAAGWQHYLVCQGSADLALLTCSQRHRFREMIGEECLLASQPLAAVVQAPFLAEAATTSCALAQRRPTQKQDSISTLDK